MAKYKAIKLAYRQVLPFIALVKQLIVSSRSITTLSLIIKTCFPLLALKVYFSNLNLYLLTPLINLKVIYYNYRYSGHYASIYIYSQKPLADLNKLERTIEQDPIIKN
jgi:hypothetical protein